MDAAGDAAGDAAVDAAVVGALQGRRQVDLEAGAFRLGGDVEGAAVLDHDGAQISGRDSRSRWHGVRMGAEMDGGVGVSARVGSEAPLDARLLVLYDTDCGLCSRTAQVLRLLDPDRRRLRLIPLRRAAAVLGAEAPAEDALRRDLHVRSASGKWLIGGRAALAIADAVPILRSVGWAGRLPGLRWLVEPAYRFVVTNRDWLGRMVGAGSCRFAGDSS